jgi:tripartite-type tricarboxylate transporter receptor subunit TctC
MMALAIVTMVLLGISSGPVLAGDYPDKSIEMVAWASPGGGSDRMCRAFAKSIEALLPEKVYVVNKKGGGGSVGMAYVQSKAADGYTLLGVTNNLVFTPLTKPNLKYSAKDFTPIIMWGFDAKGIAVAANGPYKTIEDLVTAAKQNPGGVKIGTFGLGTDDHITGYLLGSEAGTKFGYVPFDSGGEQLAALLGGHIGATVAEVQEVGAQVEAGKVRILAVATEQRLDGLPEVPTLKEKGWNVVVPKFRGLVVKKGTSPEAVNYLISRSLMAIQTPTFKNYLQKSMIEPNFLVGEGFAELIQDQEETFGKVLKELGF